MCCEYDSDATMRLRHEMADGQPVTFYKVYSLEHDRSLTSPVQNSKVTIDGKGNIVSNRRSIIMTQDELDRGEIVRGIHVHGSAERARLTQSHRQIVVPLEGVLDELVGCSAGQTHCVFRSMTVNLAKLKEIIDEELNRRKNAGEPLDNEEYEELDEEDEDWEDDEDDDDYCPSCGSSYCDGECEDEDDDWDDEEDEEEDWEDEDDDWDDDDDDDDWDEDDDE